MKTKSIYKIMIIDDSRMILKVSKDIIQKNITNTDVVVFDQAKEALEALKYEIYHIVLLDIVMPEITGIEVLKYVRSLPEYNHIKVIMFTSLNDSVAIKECFSLGAYDFVTKPIDEDEFIARLNHALNEYSQQEVIRQNMESLEIMNRQLLDLNKSLKSAQAELVQKDRLASIGHLAAGMAHEINNPLGFLGSNINTLHANQKVMLGLYNDLKEFTLNYIHEGEANAMIAGMEEARGYSFIKEDNDELYSDITHGLKRIQNIVDSLRRFSIADASQGIEPIDLNDTIDIIITMIQEESEQSVVVYEGESVKSSLQANKGDFNLSLMNVVYNAVEATNKLDADKTPRVIVKTHEDEKQIVIVIEDNGIGMNDEVIKHAFDPFYTTKDVGSGIGLGLTTAYSCFVNRMNGSMEIQSKADAGTTVIITLPK